MNIYKTAEGEKLRLVIDGNIDEATSPGLEKEMNAILEKGTKVIALDLGKVNYISSIGIRVLIMAHKIAVKSGKSITITNISGKAKEILEIVGILPLFSCPRG